MCVCVLEIHKKMNVLITEQLRRCLLSFNRTKLAIFHFQSL